MEPIGPVGSSEPTAQAAGNEEHAGAYLAKQKGRGTPWYENSPVLISFIALLFSLGTTAVSAYRTYQQDIHDTRTELRALIERIDKIPLEMIEYSNKYSSNPDTMKNISSIVNRNLLSFEI